MWVVIFFYLGGGFVGSVDARLATYVCMYLGVAIQIWRDVRGLRADGFAWWGIQFVGIMWRSNCLRAGDVGAAAPEGGAGGLCRAHWLAESLGGGPWEEVVIDVPSIVDALRHTFFTSHGWAAQSCSSKSD